MELFIANVAKKHEVAPFVKHEVGFDGA